MWAHITTADIIAYLLAVQVNSHLHAPLEFHGHMHIAHTCILHIEMRFTYTVLDSENMFDCTIYVWRKTL